MELLDDDDDGDEIVVPTGMEPLNDALRHAERVMGSHIKADDLGATSYDQYVALLDAAERLYGADTWEAAIAGLRFSGTLVYGRPMEEVEHALQRSLRALHPQRDIQARVHAVGAACNTYRQLAPYKEAEIRALRALPESELRNALLDHATAASNTRGD